MHAAIVIPCLNEQATLAATCASLGFGPGGGAASDVALFLVNNGSTDATATIMADIQSVVADRVILAFESERGYVPPRHRGVVVARDYFDGLGVPHQDVLVVQADADTTYDFGYVSALLAEACTTSGTLLEGITKTFPAFEQQHPGYHRLAKQADLAIESFLVDDADEVIVDDKVAAYRLSDYFDWGGHRREYDGAGDEIHAETSRLYLRGKMAGGCRVRVPNATAFPSRRKVELDPLLYFATAGFPREAGWLRKWYTNQNSGATFDLFEQTTVCANLTEAIFLRQAHNLLLFGFMPAYIASVLSKTDQRRVLDSPLGELTDAVSDITAADIACHPGRLFAACLPLVETRRTVFEDCLRRTRGQNDL